MQPFSPISSPVMRRASMSNPALPTLSKNRMLRQGNPGFLPLKMGVPSGEILNRSSMRVYLGKASFLSIDSTILYLTIFFLLLWVLDYLRSTFNVGRGQDLIPARAYLSIPFGVCQPLLSQSHPCRLIPSATIFRHLCQFKQELSTHQQE